MRNWRIWIIAILLFWPLVTIFILGSRWSGAVVEMFSPPQTIPLPANRIPPPPSPLPNTKPSAQPTAEKTVSQDDKLADEFWQEHLNQPGP